MFPPPHDTYEPPNKPSKRILMPAPFVTYACSTFYHVGGFQPLGEKAHQEQVI